MTQLRVLNGRNVSGFTLIEMMVVAAVIGLAATMTIVGYNIVFSRQLESEVEKLNVWIEATAETAVFQSSVLGIRADSNLFEVVAYYDNRWFALRGMETFQLPETVQWELETEDNIDFGQGLDYEEDEREPFIAFLPSGQALPEGQMIIHGSGEESVRLSWDQDAHFEVLNLEDEG